MADCGFKVGDRVVMTRMLDKSVDFMIGSTGIVIRIEDHDSGPTALLYLNWDKPDKVYRNPNRGWYARRFDLDSPTENAARSYINKELGRVQV